MNTTTPIITIDGSEASGKGTLARNLAAHLNYYHLDTGAIYRAVAYALINKNLPLDNEAICAAEAQNLVKNFDFSLLTNPQIRTALIGQSASKIAVFPLVRSALLDLQRKIAQNPPAPFKGSILDGRDTGTIICPNANLKFYLTATPESRAERRFAEFTAKGQKTTYDAVLEAIIERDHRDTTRPIAPLKPAPDAIILDTTHLNAEQALKHTLEIILPKN